MSRPWPKVFQPNGLVLAIGVLALFLGGLLHMLAIATGHGWWSNFDMALILLGLLLPLYWGIVLIAGILWNRK
jgi:hypothetical protein